MILTFTLTAVPLVVNDEIVDDSVLREERRSLQATHGGELSHEEIGRLARRTVALRILLRQKAESDPESGEEADTNVRVERLLSRATADVQRPNRKEIDTFYKLNRSRFRDARDHTSCTHREERDRDVFARRSARGNP